MASERSALFIFFGGTGDLAYRKLYPSLFNLYQKGTLREKFAVVGTARDKLTDEKFREKVQNLLVQIVKKPKSSSLTSIMKHMMLLTKPITLF